MSTAAVTRAAREQLAAFPEISQADEAAKEGRMNEMVSLLERVEDVCYSSMGSSNAISHAATWRVADAYQRINDRKRQAEKLLHLRAQLTEVQDTVQCLHELSLCSLSQGSGREAVEYAEEALVANDGTADVWKMQTAVGMGHVLFGDLQSAATAFEKAVFASKSIDTQHAAVAKWLQGGYHWHIAKEWTLASESWNGALESLSDADSYLVRARLLRDIGELEISREHTEEAKTHLNDALAAVTKYAADHWLIGSSLCQLARTFHAEDNAVTAEGYFRSSLSNLDKAGANAPISDLPYAIWEYSRLLQMWEKREAEAKLLKERASGLIDALPMEASCSRFVLPFVHHQEEIIHEEMR